MGLIGDYEIRYPMYLKVLVQMRCKNISTYDKILKGNQRSLTFIILMSFLLVLSRLF